MLTRAAFAVGLGALAGCAALVGVGDAPYEAEGTDAGADATADATTGDDAGDARAPDASLDAPVALDAGPPIVQSQQTQGFQQATYTVALPEPVASGDTLLLAVAACGDFQTQGTGAPTQISGSASWAAPDVWRGDGRSPGCAASIYRSAAQAGAASVQVTFGTATDVVLTLVELGGAWTLDRTASNGAYTANGTVSIASTTTASTAFVLLWYGDQDIQSEDAGTQLSRQADFKDYVGEELTYFPLPGPATSNVGWTFASDTSWIAAALTLTR